MSAGLKQLVENFNIKYDQTKINQLKQGALDIRNFCADGLKCQVYVIGGGDFFPVSDIASGNFYANKQNWECVVFGGIALNNFFLNNCIILNEILSVIEYIDDDASDANFRDYDRDGISESATFQAFMLTHGPQLMDHKKPNQPDQEIIDIFEEIMTEHSNQENFIKYHWEFRFFSTKFPKPTNWTKFINFTSIHDQRFANKTHVHDPMVRFFRRILFVAKDEKSTKMKGKNWAIDYSSQETYNFSCRKAVSHLDGIGKKQDKYGRKFVRKKKKTKRMNQNNYNNNYYNHGSKKNRINNNYYHGSKKRRMNNNHNHNHNDDILPSEESESTESESTESSSTESSSTESLSERVNRRRGGKGVQANGARGRGRGRGRGTGGKGVQTNGGGRRARGIGKGRGRGRGRGGKAVQINRARGRRENHNHNNNAVNENAVSDKMEQDEDEQEQQEEEKNHNHNASTPQKSLSGRKRTLFEMDSDGSPQSAYENYDDDNHNNSNKKRKLNNNQFNLKLRLKHSAYNPRKDEAPFQSASQSISKSQDVCKNNFFFFFLFCV